MTRSGSPWRAHRPLSWLSTRLDSLRSEPKTWSPPAASATAAVFSSSLVALFVSFYFTRFKLASILPPSTISVPRPAMLVAGHTPWDTSLCDNFSFSVLFGI